MGWSSFVKADGQMGFVRINKSSKELEVVMINGNDVVTADVKRVVTLSGSTVPARGMLDDE